MVRRAALKNSSVLLPLEKGRDEANKKQFLEPLLGDFILLN
jgi:hypothetical protein